MSESKLNSGEYEKYKDIFPELRDKKNWIFTGDVCMPRYSYIGPSIEELKKQKHDYDI